MGRRSTWDVRWREETFDDQTGVWIWESCYGANSSGVYVGYVSKMRTGYCSRLADSGPTVFETELVGIAGVSKDEL